MIWNTFFLLWSGASFYRLPAECCKLICTEFIIKLFIILWLTSIVNSFFKTICKSTFVSILTLRSTQWYLIVPFLELHVDLNFSCCCWSQPYARIQSQYNPYGMSGLEYTSPEWQRQSYPLLPRVRVSHNYTIQYNKGRPWKWQTWSLLRKDVQSV